MKVIIISVNQIFLAIFLIVCTPYVLFSQEEADTIRIKHPGLFFGIHLGPIQTHLVNEGSLSVSDLVSEKQNSFGGGLEIGYFFSNYIGLSSGISFVSCKTQLTLNSYQNKFNTLDTENEPYERQVSGTNIQELQKVGFLSVPVCLNIRLPLNNAIGFILQPGINLSVPVNKSYTTSGTFTFKGYYPAYNALLENLPAFGFPVNISSVSAGDLKIKSVNFNALVSAGFDFFVQKKIQVAVMACYSRSLLNNSAYSFPDKFQLSSDVNQINSLMGGSNNVSVQSIGANITFRYFIKSHF